SRSAAPDAWRRLVHLILQALETPPRGPLPKPPTPNQMRRAMGRTSARTDPEAGDAAGSIKRAPEV
ncbi:MAG TPA: hypothetical protein VGO64_08160, partial [Candidatus Limnocylindrales bacterium]|nr:hypothetical protein [Candidatus Limnocylindrales bacterium]